MSKSLGNFFTAREIGEKYGYEPIRYLMLSAQYRTQINFSGEIMEQCAASLERMYTCRDNLDFAIENAAGAGDGLRRLCDKRREEFKAAMDDDLNTADAISAVFELVRDINSAEDQSKEALQYAATVFDELTGVLGLVYNRKKSDVPDEIIEMANRRIEARKNKNFAEADALRDRIAELGFLLEDTAQGPKITKK